VIEASAEAETPISFLYWSAIAAIAATVNNGAYLNRKGIYILRPNVYVMLMAKSGLGKGFPVNVAKKLVTLAKATRVISGRNSVQSIVRDMATQQTDEKNPIPSFKDSRAFFVTSEFSSSMIKDDAALKILTDLYDCQWNEEWNVGLIGRATDKVINPNLTLLSGSSPSHFFDTIAEANITGGFVGRLLLVYEEKRSKINSLMSDVEGEKIDNFNFPYEELAGHLKCIVNECNKGERKFLWTRGAANLFETWYNQTRTTEADDKTGFKERLPDHVLKVAMCLSLSEAVDFKIREAHIEESIDMTSNLGYATKRVSEGKGKDPLAPQAKIILDYIFSSPEHTIERQKLLRKGYGDFDSAILDRIVDGIFGETGWVTKERTQVNRNGKLVYTDVYKLTNEAIRQYKKFKGE
jgi:hypothetical protein